VDVLLNSFHFLMKASTKLQTEDAELLIEPDLADFNRSDMGQVEELMEKGYKDSKEVLKKI